MNRLLLVEDKEKTPGYIVKQRGLGYMWDKSVVKE
jgi:hypothetical protein